MLTLDDGRHVAGFLLGQQPNAVHLLAVVAEDLLPPVRIRVDRPADTVREGRVAEDGRASHGWSSGLLLEAPRLATRGPLYRADFLSDSTAPTTPTPSTRINWARLLGLGRTRSRS